jgi:hypothetical protein
MEKGGGKFRKWREKKWKKMEENGRKREKVREKREKT